jgi:hypothetical protein
VASIDLSAVAERFALGLVPGEPRPVAVGALSNRLWRVDTAHGSFAVKEMVSHADQEWLVPQVEAAFAIELRARDAGVPVPQPVPDPLTGRCLAGIGGRLVRVHQWMSGRCLAPGGPDRRLTGLAGDLLARIHLAAGPPGGGVSGAGEPFAAGHWAALAGRIEQRAPALAGQVRADAAFLAALQARTTVPALPGTDGIRRLDLLLGLVAGLPAGPQRGRRRRYRDGRQGGGDHPGHAAARGAGTRGMEGTAPIVRTARLLRPRRPPTTNPQRRRH